MRKYSLPAPSDLSATNDSELVAILLTMDFPTPDDAMAVCSGDGIAGRRGYWRFLPADDKGYSLKQVLKHGTRATLAATPGAYRVQAYMAACMHNYRLLVESLQHGTRLRVQKCAYLWLLQREQGNTPPTHHATPQERAEWLAHGSHNTAMVAGMVTLGFTPYNVAAPDLSAVSHGRLMRTWYLPATSADGQWQRAQVMALWNDVAWCARPDNDSPVAAMSDCMWNLKYIRAQNGGKTAFICADAAQSVWDKAEKFLE
ncbi:MAG: hypothetical protein E7031_02445 [Akkermansiaceae bacterium]|nr:hypothetical protein [Akkermansiaceae bacterium]